MTIINAKQSRTYNIGTKIMSDETIMLDLNEGNGNFSCGNIPIRELIEHLNAIEGVSATYEKPKPIPALPKGLGAVVQIHGIRYVRDGFDEQYPWSSELRRSEFPDNWHGFKTPNLVILSEGVQP